MPFYLKNKAKSYFNPNKTYGNAGDEVQVISSRGDLWAVEINGNKFYTHKDNLKETKPLVPETKEEEPVKQDRNYTKPVKKPKEGPTLF